MEGVKSSLMSSPINKPWPSSDDEPHGSQDPRIISRSPMPPMISSPVATPPLAGTVGIMSPAVGLSQEFRLGTPTTTVGTVLCPAKIL
ncbi:hypothetical protein ACP4OV_027899 [Aristida adscensionis]